MYIMIPGLTKLTKKYGLHTATLSKPKKINFLPFKLANHLL